MYMGSTYQAMVEAKENIMNNFNNNERNKLLDDLYLYIDKLATSTEVVDNIHGKLTNNSCCSVGCERNWSVFEHIHSKKRIRLEHQKLQDMVFIKYNQSLKERFNSNDVIDHVGHGWLLGDEVGAQPNLVFHCDLYWVDVNIASGIVELEPRINTRSQTTLILTYLCILLKELFLHSE
ncbi:hypothetical protein QL285_044205 [Trifolium repens]|nr:hypothetical protein QL285_044205 [Trifolium repens]